MGEAHQPCHVSSPPRAIAPHLRRQSLCRACRIPSSPTPPRLPSRRPPPPSLPDSFSAPEHPHTQVPTLRRHRTLPLCSPPLARRWRHPPRQSPPRQPPRRQAADLLLPARHTPLCPATPLVPSQHATGSASIRFSQRTACPWRLSFTPVTRFSSRDRVQCLRLRQHRPCPRFLPLRQFPRRQHRQPPPAWGSTTPPPR
jgi:hypothetical protein